MKLGPKEVCEKLSRILENVEDLREKSREFLQAYKDRISSSHKAAVVHSIPSNLQIVIAVLGDGNLLAGMTLSDPFVKSPSPYRMTVDIQNISKIIGEVFGWPVPSVKSGIFELPLKVKFLAIVGPDKWMKKEIFQEKIKGSENICFAEKVNDVVFNRILDLKNHASENIYTSVDDDGIHIAFTAPDYVDDDKIPLLSEMAKVIKSRMKLSTSRFSKLSKQGRIIATATLPLEELWKVNPLEKATNMMRRTLNGYEAFLKGAGIG